jgi:hypothetical protein
MKTVTIENDSGEATGTRVIDGATGEQLRGVRKIQVDIEVDKPNRALIEMVMPRVNVVARSTWMLAHPMTGQMKAVRSIEFIDGEKVEF